MEDIQLLNEIEMHQVEKGSAELWTFVCNRFVQDSLVKFTMLNKTTCCFHLKSAAQHTCSAES